jgi:putative component of membrane protein insertase Oxa1/YidC/SpoIIIJ protein YidD
MPRRQESPSEIELRRVLRCKPWREDRAQNENHQQQHAERRERLLQGACY